MATTKIPGAPSRQVLRWRAHAPEAADADVFKGYDADVRWMVHAARSVSRADPGYALRPPPSASLATRNHLIGPRWHRVRGAHALFSLATAAGTLHDMGAISSVPRC